MIKISFEKIEYLLLANSKFNTNGKKLPFNFILKLYIFQFCLLIISEYLKEKYLYYYSIILFINND